MYNPVRKPKDLARSLVDIAREETDAPIKACSTTVNLILIRLMKVVTSIDELRNIQRAFHSDHLLDWHECFDSKVLGNIIAHVSENIDDKEQHNWTLQDDEDELIELIDKFTSVMVKADERVVLRHLSNFEFLKKLVVLYEVEQRSSVRNAVAKALSAACKLSRKITFEMLCSNLPVILVQTNAFKPPLSKLENSSLRLLQTLYSTNEKPPQSHNGKFKLGRYYFTPDFLERMLELVKTGDQNALLFMVNYNYQFDEDASPVLDILRSHDSLSFGHTLIKHLSKNKNDEDISTLKLIYDIYVAPNNRELISSIFYTNDLQVLAVILSQILLETNVPRKITMILEIFEEIIREEKVSNESIFSSLRTFIKSDSLEESVILKAQSLVPPELLLDELMNEPVEPFDDPLEQSESTEAT
uniref:DUF2013 domain-containing protein n=1 Tax=Syphacia muris TaxID=451379 RepID=A0A0N5ATE0_9BILA